MCESTMFCGLNHYPLGDADLSTQGNELIISNLTSCKDGVMISAPNVSNFVASFNPVEITENVSIVNTSFEKDGFNRLKTTGQVCVYFDSESGHAAIAVNSRLMPSTFSFIGEYQGQEVFRTEFDNTNPPPFVNWWQIALAVAGLILENIDYKKIVEKDGDGNVIKETTQWSIGSGGVVNPGGSGGGTPVEIDHCYVEAIETFSPPKPPVLGSVLEELQLTAQGVGQIVMTNETYS